jgi:hypothetical protein
MRQETINIYQYDELSTKAKEKAVEWYQEGQEIFWRDEYLASLKAFADMLGLTIKNYSMDGLSSFTYAVLDMSEHFTLAKTALPALGCEMTGYAGDDDLLASLHAVKGKSVSADDIKEALDAWSKSVDADAQYQVSEEAIAEHIIANEYEFTVAGSIY